MTLYRRQSWTPGTHFRPHPDGEARRGELVALSNCIDRYDFGDDGMLTPS